MKQYWAAGLTIVAAVTITVVVAGQTAKPPATSVANGTLLDDLVVANRILANENILDGLGHVSVRSLQRPDHFFLARDLAPGLVTAADLVEYDLDGNPVNSKAPQGYRERFLHAAIFKARPDVNSSSIRTCPLCCRSRMSPPRYGRCTTWRRSSCRAHRCSR